MSAHSLSYLRIRRVDGRARRRLWRRVILIAGLGALIAAGMGTAALAAGSAPLGWSAPAATQTDVKLADRTLVPKRIRLITGWKRPRLA